MSNEQIRKKYWLNHFTNRNKNWVDGDTQDRNLKTADFVNNELKIAIELKVEESKDYWFPRFSSNRVIPYLESANNKFKNYPGYKTILFVESDCTVREFQQSEGTIYQARGESLFVKNRRRANKIFNNVGAIILWPHSKDVHDSCGYGWEYQEADQNRKINYQTMTYILGVNIRHYLDSPDFSPKTPDRDT